MKKDPRLGGEQSKGHGPLTKQNTGEKNNGEHFSGNVALKEWQGGRTVGNERTVRRAERDTKFLLQGFAEGKRNWVSGQVAISVTKQGAAVCPGHGWRQLNTLPTPSAQEPALLPQHDSAYARCMLGHPCARVLSKDREIWLLM